MGPKHCGAQLGSVVLLRHGLLLLSTLLLVLGVPRVQAMPAPQADKPDAILEKRIQDLRPKLEDYVAAGMKSFDVPGVALGIVAGDKLVYSKGWGVRKKGGAPVDTKTVFGIGSTTKAFLATTIAIAVDHKKLHWDDRVVDLDPDFQLSDPWVTREFRVFDLLAQRSGMPPYANDMMGILGYDEKAMVRSLRYVQPVSSFRSTFAYTNITHIVAGNIVAKAEGAPDWNAVCRKELADRMSMRDTSYTADAIQAAPNHAEGYRYSPQGSVEIPYDQFFPYNFGGAGDMNSNIEDMARWVRLQLGNGSFEGQEIVSPENLAFTRIPKVGMTDKVAYALGWIIMQTPNGNIVWHNGGTSGIGAFVGLQLDKQFGVIILTNQGNVGFPDALGLWIFDRLLGNAQLDHVRETLKRAKQKFADGDKMFAKPADPKPSLALAPLAGPFSNPSFGKASLKHGGDGLVLALSTGAQFQLDPWDGDIFTARILPDGRFAPVAQNMGPSPSGFVQFQMDKEGKLNMLHLSFDDRQAYDFRREAASTAAASR